MSKWDGLFSDMTAIGNLEFEEFEQMALVIQVVEIQKVESNVATLVYSTLGNASLTNWTQESLPIVFSTK